MSRGVSFLFQGSVIHGTPAVFVAVLGLAVSMAWGGPLWAETPPPGGADAQVGGSAIVARGRIDVPIRMTTLYASTTTATPMVARVSVVEGEALKKDQVVATLSNQDLASAVVRVAEQELRLAEEKLKAVQGPARDHEVQAKEAEIDAAVAKQRQTASQAHRANQLRQTDAMAAAAEELRVQEHAEAQANLEMARHQLVAMREQLRTDRAIAAVERDRAEAQLAQAKAELETTLVRAPFDAVVLKVFAHDGGAVAGTGIARIADLQSLRVIADVPEVDAARVRVGNEAFTMLRGSTTPLPGHVTRIANVVNRQNRPDPEAAAPSDAHMVEVEVEVNDLASLPPIIGYETTVRITP
ncbi:HlyD family secretion protein [Pararhodospirillum oryzae]|uniref:Hemolysin D n=1 Tax=Pararhodospirillum oryzae TaxID=478448 RepID=A0A512HA45_9PROT|nr:HlyD family efflux transporter periplasmic adaptor subunit [Pararhodospirillum oryzae]GEO82309.1 hypothetical protein ROR02_24400 [Pararhodospirillum oryzae]